MISCEKKLGNSSVWFYNLFTYNNFSSIWINIRPREKGERSGDPSLTLKFTSLTHITEEIQKAIYQRSLTRTMMTRLIAVNQNPWSINKESIRLRSASLNSHQTWIPYSFLPSFALLTLTFNVSNVTLWYCAYR